MYAGFWKRALAWVIDTSILGIGGAIVGGLAGAGIVMVLRIMGAERGVIESTAQVAGFFLGIGLNWIYFTIFESSARQATLGKMAIGITVTDLEGKRIDFARANARYWSKFISAILLLLGFVIAGFTRKKQALHDMIASTLVVNRKDVPLVCECDTGLTRTAVNE